MGAHSIGPWSVVKKYNGTVVIAAHGGLVASMEAGSQSMRDANASLIAAAPDLLEALRALLWSMTIHDGEDGTWGAEEARAARAAIERAEGN